MACCCPAWVWGGPSRPRRNTYYRAFDEAEADHAAPPDRSAPSPSPDPGRTVPRLAALPKGTIFTHNKTLPAWEVRVLVCGASNAACTALAEWLTTRTDSPREIASPKARQTPPAPRPSHLHSRITKVMALSKEGEGEGEGGGGVGAVPKSQRPTLATTSLNLYAVTFGMWVPSGKRPGKEFLASFEDVGERSEGNLAVLVAFDVASIASFEWARHFLEGGLPPSLAASPRVLVGVWTTNARARQVPAEEAASVARDQAVPLVEVCCVSEGGATPEILPGLDTSADELLQSLVNTSKQ